MSGIEINNLTVKYAENIVFENFCAEFAENKISVILGDSGVGKSTLLNCIASLKDYQGAISGNKAGISYIFQKDRLIPAISIYKNLDLVLKAQIKDKLERKKRIENMLEALEIAEQSHKLPSELSGGQAQRAALARAFLYPGEVLLLDEPFKALDTALKSRLLKALVELEDKSPRTAVFVTHAIDECLLAADEYFVLSGAPAEIVLHGSIDGCKSSRSLADEALEPIRASLLKSLLSSAGNASVKASG